LIQLSIPHLLGAMFVGLIVSLLQATSSIQEQTLSFVPKMITVFILLILLSTWMLKRMLSFTEYILSNIPVFLLK